MSIVSDVLNLGTDSKFILKTIILMTYTLRKKQMITKVLLVKTVCLLL